MARQPATRQKDSYINPLPTVDVLVGVYNNKLD